MGPALNTVGALYDYCQGPLGYDQDISITIRIKDLAALIWQAEANGVRCISDQHNAQVAEMRKRATACRYHNMGHSIIGAPGAYGDVIYDPRYSEHYRDWEIHLTIPEEAL